MEGQALFKRDFTLVVIGQIISLFGAAILRFALSIYVIDISGRADIFAGILALSTLPIIFISPIGGAIADRFNKKKLMVIYDFTNSLVVFIFIVLIKRMDSSLGLIAIIMILLSIISTMYQPTVQASIPAIVDRENLIKANGIVSQLGVLTNIAGPILGGLLYSTMGLGVIAFVSCISFFLSACMEIFIRIPFTKRPEKASMVLVILRDLKEGLAYISHKNRDILKIMLLAAGLNLFLVPLFLVGLPYIIKVSMGGSDLMLGIAQASISIGGILGAIFVSVIGKRMQLNRVYLWILLLSIFLLPMALAVYQPILERGFWTSFSLLLVSSVLIFLITTMISIFCISLIQKETPKEYLGKIMAILFAASTCATPIGQIIYGLILEKFHSRVYVSIIVACVFSLIMAVLAGLIFKNNKVGKVESYVNEV